MKKFIVVLIGLAIIGVALYFFLFCGIVDLIDQIKNGVDDTGKLAWAIIRLFPLFEIIFGIGIVTTFSGGAWALSDKWDF